MRSYTVRCPNPQCRVMLVIPEEMMGLRVRCAGCSHLFVVPLLLSRADKTPKRYRKAS